MDGADVPGRADLDAGVAAADVEEARLADIGIVQEDGVRDGAASGLVGPQKVEPSAIALAHDRERHVPEKRRLGGGDGGKAGAVVVGERFEPDAAECQCRSGKVHRAIAPQSARL